MTRASRSVLTVAIISGVLSAISVVSLSVLGKGPGMEPSSPPTPVTPSASDEPTNKTGVYVSIDKKTGNLVYSANPSSGVKITAETVERLDTEKRMYDTGFFYGYVKGFEHFQNGGKFESLIGGGPLRPTSDNPISDMGEFQGKMSGWRAAMLAQSINAKTR